MSTSSLPYSRPFSSSTMSSGSCSTSSIRLVRQTRRLDIGLEQELPFSRSFPQGFIQPGDVSILVDSADLSNVLGHMSVFDDHNLEQFSNIKDVHPEWDANEMSIEQSVNSNSPRSLLSEKHFAPIAQDTLSSFQILHPPSPQHKLCIYRPTGAVYALKTLHPASPPSVEQVVLERLAAVARRDEMLAAFLPRLRWCLHDRDNVHIILDYYSSTSVFDEVTREGPLPTEKVLFYASELAVALSTLHSRDVDVIHGNLNPSNVVFDANGHIIIGGLENSLLDVRQKKGITYGELEVFPSGVYRAPEIILGWRFDAAVDCWGFGIVLYFMLFGTRPFADLDGLELYDKILEAPIQLGDMSKRRESVPLSLQDLILKCLQRNPALRLDIKSIMRHACFARVDWEKVIAKQATVPSFRESIVDTRWSGGPTIHTESSASSLNEPTQQHVEIASQGLFEHIPSMQTSPEIVQTRPPSASGTSVRAIPAHTNEAKPETETNTPLAPSASSQFSPNMSNVTIRQEHPNMQCNHTTTKERMQRFWEMIDEESSHNCLAGDNYPSQVQSSSNIRMRIGKKLRKQPRHPTAFNFEQQKRRVSCSEGSRSWSAGTLSTSPRSLLELPGSVEQIGLGIGYNRAISPLPPIRKTQSCYSAIIDGVHKLGSKMGAKGRKVSLKCKTTNLHPSVEFSDQGSVCVGDGPVAPAPENIPVQDLELRKAFENRRMSAGKDEGEIPRDSSL